MFHRGYLAHLRFAFERHLCYLLHLVVFFGFLGGVKTTNEQAG